MDRRVKPGDDERRVIASVDCHHTSCPEYEQLKDLLHSGKSATILPLMAASSSGHWNTEASRTWPPVAMRNHTRRSPRNASTTATPSRGALAGGTGTCTGPAGRPESHSFTRRMLTSVSRMRTHTRALTSPPEKTGTSNTALS